MVMSLERYANNHNLPREVQNVREPGQSPVGALATLFISDAEAELLSLNRGANSPFSSVLTQDRPANLRRRDPDYTRKVEALLYWGNAILSLEDIIKTGEYSHLDYVTRVNLSIGKYGGTKARERDIIIRYKDFPDEYWDIARRAQGDPTLATFISDSSALLPEPIRHLWIEKKVFEHIAEMQVGYRRAAQKVIAREVDPDERKRDQRLTLQEHDEYYLNFVDGLQTTS